MNRNTGIAALLGILAFAVWLHFDRIHTRELALLDSHKQVTDSMVLALKPVLRQDSIRRDSLKLLVSQWGAERRKDSVAIAKVRGHTDTLKVRFDSILPDTLKPLFDSIVAGKDTQIVALTRQNTSLRAEVDLWRIEVGRKDSLLTQVNASLRRALRERDQYRGLSQPNIFKQFTSALPWVGVALLADHFLTR